MSALRGAFSRAGSANPEEVATAALRVLVLVLLAGSVFPPFVPLAGPLSADDLPSLLAVGLAASALLFTRRRITLDATAAGFAALALLGVLSATANAGSFSELARLAGRSAGRCLFFALLITSLRALISRGAWPKVALAVFASAATAESLFCLWALAVKYRGPYGLGVLPFPEWSVLHGSYRVQGTFSGVATEFETEAVSANFLAAYLVMAVPVTASMVLAARPGPLRLVLALATLCQLAALYLTYTRAALVALAAPVLVIGWLTGRRRLSAMLLIAGIVFTLAIPSVRRKMLGEGHNRYALWVASLYITRDHPIAGVGDGNYDRVLYSKQAYFETPFGVSSTASHNSILLSAAYHGVAGGLANVLLYVLLALSALRAVKAVRARDPTGRDVFLAAGIAGGLAGYLVQDQFNNLLYVPKVVTQLWYLVAVLGALAAVAGAEPGEAGEGDDQRLRAGAPRGEAPARAPGSVDARGLG